MDPKQEALVVTVFVNQNCTGVNNSFSFQTGADGDATMTSLPEGILVEDKEDGRLIVPWSSISHIVGVPVD